MAFGHWAFGLLLLAFFALSTVTASAEEEVDYQVLSASQIVRFINSYPAIHAMARNYWGERKHTPNHKMLKSKGTFERAITEMKWAGKLPDFDNLLQSAGFDNQKVWMTLVKRISLAHMILRLKEVNPQQLERYRQNRRRQLAEIQEKIRALEDTSDGTPTVYSAPATARSGPGKNVAESTYGPYGATRRGTAKCPVLAGRRSQAHVECAASNGKRAGKGAAG